MNFNFKGENYGNEIMAHVNRVRESEFRNDFYEKHEYKEEDIMEYYKKDDSREPEMLEKVMNYLRSDY